MSNKVTYKRARNPDFSKIAAILNLLREYPDGLWLNEIKNRLKWKSSGSISRYADGVMGLFVENIGFKDDNDRYVGLRVIRLKPQFREWIFTPESVKKAVETQKFLKSIGK